MYIYTSNKFYKPYSINWNEGFGIYKLPGL